MSHLDQLTALRETFDHHFSLRPNQVGQAGVKLQAISVLGRPFALLLSELAGLGKLGKLVRLPGGLEGFRGVVGVRGRLVAVYSLARLLGFGRDEGEGWLALLGEDASVGFAFAHILDTHVVPPEALHPVDPDHANKQYITAVWAADPARPVVSLPRLAHALRQKLGVPAHLEEKRP